MVCNMKPIDHYKVVVFDCDGVLLNSNRIKTDAFYAVTLKYGEEFASHFRTYHVANGGISRYKKFDYFFASILQREPYPEEKENLLADYAAHVLDELMVCEVVEGLEELKAITMAADWMVASGGDQQELRQVFRARDLDKLFKRGIFGSPTPKDEILKTLVSEGADPLEILMIGDSAFDYRAAESVGADFVFASYWTEMPDWQQYASLKGFSTVESLREIIEKRS